MNNPWVLGVDVGGSHITAAVIDIQNRTVLENSLVRASVNAGAAATDIIDDWCGVIKKSMAFKPGISKIGIAMPGPFDYDNGICLITGLNKYEALYGLDLQQKLATQLNMQPRDILFTNDAQCFLAGELFAGSVTAVEPVIGLTLGTGFGSAYSVDGVTKEAGYWCVPFMDSRAEDYFSTRWFIHRYRQLSGNTINNVQELAHAAVTHAHARQVFDEFSNNLAAFLNQVMQTNNASLVIVGGGIAAASELFFDKLHEALLQKGRSVRLQLSTLGERAMLIGAASYRR